MVPNTEIAIQASELTKVFRIDAGYRHTLSETIKDAFHIFRNRAKKPAAEYKTAINDVSLSIPKGSTVGLIGRNGSGKSTLLRILSGIMQPTRGSIRIIGKTTSILDIGSGFIGDLTGRENVLMSGTLLGMDETTILDRLDEIVAFSEIGEYFDVPVKYYSSGMYLRLAFSLSVHLDAEVMLIDEVIEVGDEAFKIKSYNKLKELTGKGLTIILCTHNMRSVMELCNYCLVMDEGALIAEGPAQQMVETYLEHIWGKSYEEAKGNLKLSYQHDSLMAPADKMPVQLTQFTFEQPNATKQLFTDESLTIRFRYKKLTAETAIHHSIWIFDNLHRPILSGNSMPFIPQEEPDLKGEYEVSVDFPSYFFNKGLFFLRLHFLEGNKRLLYEYPQQFPFRMHLREIDPANLKIDGKVGSPLYIQLPWQKTKID